MKNKKRLLAILTALSLAVTSVPVSVTATTFDRLDANTAVAGASEALQGFYKNNTNPSKKIAELLYPVISVNGNENVSGKNEAGETTELSLYGEVKKGIVSAPAFLNVRESASTLANILGEVVRGTEVEILGERKVNGNLWYKISLNGVSGFASGNYIATGAEYDAFLAQIEEEKKQPVQMPEKIVLGDEFNWLNPSQQTKVKSFVSEINFCMTSVYPERLAAEDYIGTYSTLVYIIELCQSVSDIAFEHSMSTLYDNVNNVMATANLNREKLSALTGESEDDFYKEILAKDEEYQKAQKEAEEKKRRAEEEAAKAKAAQEAAAKAAQDEAARKAALAAQEQARLAQAQAEAAARAAQEQAQQAQQATIQEAAQEGAGTLGRQIADYAATFVGWLPYVWGGASLSSGADCSGFCGQILAHFGLLNQSEVDWHKYCSGDFRSLGRPVDVSQMQPGDILCYNGHVAIYFGKGIIVHEPSAGRMCEYGGVYLSCGLICVRRLW